jgi:hypothetical protein
MDRRWTVLAVLDWRWTFQLEVCDWFWVFFPVATTLAVVVGGVVSAEFGC